MQNNLIKSTLSNIIKDVTQVYLDTLDTSDGFDLAEIEADIVSNVSDNISIINAAKDKSKKLTIPKQLNASQIADVMLRLYPIRRIIWSGKPSDKQMTLAVYQTDGIDEGTYVSDNDWFENTIEKLNYGAEDRVINSVMRKLNSKAKCVYPNRNRDLIAVNNGIFNYISKELQPFDPDIIFTSKSHVNYCPIATNPIIHNDEDGTDWDVETWMKEISNGNQEICDLLWQVIGATIRPNVSWNKCVCFYSTVGNNGKGTLCHLMHKLLGDGSYATIPIASFDKDFMLEELVHISAVICDENSTGCYVKDASSFKSIITNDPVQINRKFEKAVKLVFHGLMVQCINGLPKFSDKTESLYRRFLLIPFELSFTGQERKYIKNNYLEREDVLEYVLYRVLNSNYYEFDNPTDCEKLLSEYKTFNDPVRQFTEEVLPNCVWDLLPYAFLYDLYKAWFALNCPGGSIQSNMPFVKDLKQIMAESDEWEIPQNAVPTRNKMDKTEYMIIDYGLTNWMNSNYRGSDRTQICTPMKASSYRGLLRK